MRPCVDARHPGRDLMSVGVGCGSFQLHFVLWCAYTKSLKCMESTQTDPYPDFVSWTCGVQLEKPVPLSHLPHSHLLRYADTFAPAAICCHGTSSGTPIKICGGIFRQPSEVSTVALCRCNYVKYYLESRYFSVHIITIGYHNIIGYKKRNFDTHIVCI